MLLEVVVALLFISIGFITYLDFQFKSQNALQALYYHDIAMYQCVSLKERLRANEDYLYRENEINRWEQENQALLPKGKSRIDCSQSICLIEIGWKFRKWQWLRARITL